MAILSMPSLTDFSSVRFGPVTNTLAHTSSLNKTTQTVELAGNRWSLEGPLRLMTEDDAEPWLAFLAEMDGPAGRCYAGDPRRLTPRGAPGTSAPLVDGADQTGKTLVTDAWDVSTSGLLLKGDYFAMDLPSGGRSLHKLTADADSDGGGAVTLNFRPAIRESPADNEPLIITNPTCVMRLTDDMAALTEGDADGFYKIPLSLIESYNTG